MLPDKQTLENWYAEDGANAEDARLFASITMRQLAAAFQEPHRGVSEPKPYEFKELSK